MSTKGNPLSKWEESAICILKLMELLATAPPPPVKLKEVVLSTINLILRRYDSGLGINLNKKSPPKRISVDLFKNPTKETRKDHALPINALSISILEEVLKNPQEYPATIVGAGLLKLFIQEHIIIVEITKSEDDHLTKEGYRQEMPRVWDQGTQAEVPWEFGDDPYSRYIAAKIDLIEVDANRNPVSDKTFFGNQIYP